jgi:tRNA(Leu) C34 or U34 (ribose-2'-O)-methylase TrmL
MPASIALINPKYPHNVAAAVRAAACFGATEVRHTGKRVDFAKMPRTPREMRMKAYKDVWVTHSDYMLHIPEGVTPVAIELVPGAESLPYFLHPHNAMYIFGPEDGTLDRPILRLCHRFVSIPTFHCMNLSSAVYVVLYDRLVKRGEAPDTFKGWLETDDHDMAEIHV